MREGSKAVWNFSEKSSDLETPPDPKKNLKPFMGMGMRRPGYKKKYGWGKHFLTLCFDGVIF